MDLLGYILAVIVVATWWSPEQVGKDIARVRKAYQKEMYDAVSHS